MAFVYLEVFAIYQPTCRCNRKIIAGGVEVDAFQCLFDVKLSRLSGVVNSVSVKNSVRGVGWCLNLSY